MNKIWKKTVTFLDSKFKCKIWMRKLFWENIWGLFEFWRFWKISDQETQGSHSSKFRQFCDNWNLVIDIICKFFLCFSSWILTNSLDLFVIFLISLSKINFSLISILKNSKQTKSYASMPKINQDPSSQDLNWMQHCDKFVIRFL